MGGKSGRLDDGKDEQVWSERRKGSEEEKQVAEVIDKKRAFTGRECTVTQEAGVETGGREK